MSWYFICTFSVCFHICPVCLNISKWKNILWEHPGVEKLGLRGPSLSSQIHVMLRSLTSLQRSCSNTVLEPTPPEPQAMTDAFSLFSGSGVIDGGGRPSMGFHPHKQFGGFHTGQTSNEPVGEWNSLATTPPFFLDFFCGHPIPYSLPFGNNNYL